MSNCYIKMTVSAIRSSTDVMQFADLNFYDSSDNRISYPSGTTAITNMTTFSGEGAANVLDNNSSTKICGQWNGSPKYVLITVPDETFLQNVKKYNYCTANDFPERDPITWILEYSLDGTNYVTLDNETGVTITTSRYTQTQKWECAVPAPYKTNGTAILSLSDYVVGGNDSLYWTATTPEGTSVVVSTSVNNGAWQGVSNAGAIQGMPAKGQTCNLRIKAELSTTDTSNTPSVSQIKITTDDDEKVIVLGLNVPNITPAIGSAQISYDGLGALAGVGGPVEAFSGTFTPSGMTWKGGQNDIEHLRFLGTSASVTLRPILIYNTKSVDEHIEIASVGANVVLTDIHDL